jgi:hypothetical protein
VRLNSEEDLANVPSSSDSASCSSSGIPICNQFGVRLRNFRRFSRKSCCCAMWKKCRTRKSSMRCRFRSGP